MRGGVGAEREHRLRGFRRHYRESDCAGRHAGFFRLPRVQIMRDACPTSVVHEGSDRPRIPLFQRFPATPAGPFSSGVRKSDIAVTPFERRAAAVVPQAEIDLAEFLAIPQRWLAFNSTVFRRFGRVMDRMIAREMFKGLALSAPVQTD